jgi:hypothetical protein
LPHFQFAQEHGVGEIAVVADGHAPGFAEVEMDAIHGAMAAHVQRIREAAVEAFEREVTGNDGVLAELHVIGKRAVQPFAGFVHWTFRSRTFFCSLCIAAVWP